MPCDPHLTPEIGSVFSIDCRLHNEAIGVFLDFRRVTPFKTGVKDYEIPNNFKLKRNFLAQFYGNSHSCRTGEKPGLPAVGGC